MLTPSREILAVLELSGQKNVLGLCKRGQLPLDIVFDDNNTLRKSLLFYAASQIDPNLELIQLLGQDAVFSAEFKAKVLEALVRPAQVKNIDPWLHVA